VGCQDSHQSCPELASLCIVLVANVCMRNKTKLYIHRGSRPVAAATLLHTPLFCRVDAAEPYVKVSSKSLVTMNKNKATIDSMYDSPHECCSTSLTLLDVDTKGVLDGLLCFAEPVGEVGMAGAAPLMDSPLLKLSALHVSRANAHALVQCHHASLQARHAAFLACGSGGLSASMSLLHTVTAQT